MPDIDPLTSLDHFSEGLHVNPLPASEVRRRGDRMRRRNIALATAGGVVAAAVFIGTPVALMSGGDDGPDVQPAPSPSVTDPAPVDWITEIPEDFVLTDDMVTGAGELTEGDRHAFALCDMAYPTSPGTSATTTVSYSDDGESSVQRTFQLWPDDARADESIDRLLEGVQDCPQQPSSGGEDIVETTLVDFPTGGDRSVSFAQQYVGDDGLLSQLTTVQVTRVGNAVLINSGYGSAGGDEAMRIASEILDAQSSDVRQAMCRFAADPCEVPEMTESSAASRTPSSA